MEGGPLLVFMAGGRPTGSRHTMASNTTLGGGCAEGDLRLGENSPGHNTCGFLGAV